MYFFVPRIQKHEKCMISYEFKIANFSVPD